MTGADTTFTIAYLDTTSTAQVVTVPGNQISLYETGITYYPNISDTSTVLFFPWSRILEIQAVGPAPNWI
jgi:hypothetical protein